MTGTVTFNDTDSTTRATAIAAAMVNAVHPNDRSESTYEDAANEASAWMDQQGIGCPDQQEILKNLERMFGVSYWDFS